MNLKFSGEPCNLEILLLVFKNLKCIHLTYMVHVDFVLTFWLSIPLFQSGSWTAKNFVCGQ